MAGITEVGARVTLTGAAKAIRTTLKLAEANDKLAASYDRVAEASKASAGSTDAAAVSSKEAAAAAATSGSGVVAGSKQRTKALTEEEKALKKTEQAHSDFSTKVKSIAASSVGTFGKWGALGFLGLSYEGIKQYQTYQYKITQLMTQAGVQQKNLAGLYSGGLTISKTTGLHLSTVGNQLYRIASARAGLHATNAELLSLSRQAANVAVLFNTAPGGPTEQVARIFGALATARTSGLRTVGSNKHMAALINATVGGSDIRGSTLIGGLGRGVLQSGSAVGASLPTILAWIGASTKFGAQASSSGTLIAHSLQQLATPSAQGQAAEAMFGIKQGELKSLISHQGIRAAISDFLGKIEGGGLHVTATMPSTLSQRTKGMTNRQDALTKLLSWGLNRTLLAKLTAGGPLSKNTQSALLQFIMTKAFGGARQEIPLLTLTQSHVFTSTLTYIKKHATTKNFQKDLIKAYSTPQQQQRIAEANLQVGLAQFGKAIDPMWIKFLHGLVDFVDYFAKHSDALKALLIGFGSLAGVGLSAIALKHVLSWVDAFKKLFGIFGIASKVSPQLAADTQMSAAEMQLAAARMNLGSKGVPGGVPRTPGVPGAPGEEPLPGATPWGDSLIASVAAPLVALGGIVGIAALAGKYRNNNTVSNDIARLFGTSTPVGGVRTHIFVNPVQIDASQRAMQEYFNSHPLKAPLQLITPLTGKDITGHRTAQKHHPIVRSKTRSTRPTAPGNINPSYQIPSRTPNHPVPSASNNWLLSGALFKQGNAFGGQWGHGGATTSINLLHAMATRAISWEDASKATTAAKKKFVHHTLSTTAQKLAFYAALYKQKAAALEDNRTPHKQRLGQQYQSGYKMFAAQAAAYAAAAHGLGLTGSRGAPIDKAIRSARDVVSSHWNRIANTPTMDAKNKVDSQAATLQHEAAILMRDAAKKHGDAAQAEKEAAQTMSDAANKLNNVHVNVNLTGSALTKAVNTAQAQAVARA